jgi:hypothetical protein
MKKVMILNEEYDIEDRSKRNLNQLVWRILFEAKPEQLDREETRFKNDQETGQFFQKAYNIAYLLSVVNRRKLQDCRPEPLSNRYLPNLEEDHYLAYKHYLGRERAKDFLRYLNKWIPLHSRAA